MSLGGNYRRASVIGHGIVTRELSKRVLHSQIQSVNQWVGS